MGGVSRQGPPLYTQQEGAVWLATQVASRRVFAAGKLGTSELESIVFYLGMRRGEIKYPYTSGIKKNMSVNAGIFPVTDEVIDDWVKHMITEVLPEMDGMAEWYPMGTYESQILNMFSGKSKRFPARSLEPYYESEKSTRWTMRIPDKTKVAVVSPFAASITSQWAKQAEIWPTTPVWNANIELIPIKAYYNPYLSPDKTWPNEVERGGWRAAIAYLTKAVVESGAKIAVIGIGALSLPLCASLKKHGISAIHNGGATQILFGIKGRRWTTHNVISGFFNSAWVEPTPEEIPSNKHVVEGGCYW
jgi:hypothetical protein